MNIRDLAKTNHRRISITVISSALLAGQPAVGHTDDSVDNALKGRDLNTIMELLKKEAQTDVVGAGQGSVATRGLPAPQVKPDTGVRANPKIRRLRPVPVAASTRGEKKVEPSPAPVRTSDGKGESFTRQELDRIQSALAEELKAARAAAERDAAATASMATRIPVTVEPAPMIEAATTRKADASTKSRGLLGRLFGGGDAKPEKAQQYAEAAPAGPTAPAVRTAIPERPAMGPRTNSMKSNRDRLENLISRSRSDVVRRSMEESARMEEARAPEYSEDDWKKAGPDAWRYNGEWSEGSMHGQGRLIYADGWEYVGMWQDGNMHGQGTLVHPDGTIYEGQWANGMMDGLGKLTYPDGWQFIGQWRAGKIQGQGTLVHPGN